MYLANHQLAGQLSSPGQVHNDTPVYWIYTYSVYANLWWWEDCPGSCDHWHLILPKSKINPILKAINVIWYTPTDKSIMFTWKKLIYRLRMIWLEALKIFFFLWVTNVFMNELKQLLHFLCLCCHMTYLTWSWWTGKVSAISE